MSLTFNTGMLSFENVKDLLVKNGLSDQVVANYTSLLRRVASVMGLNYWNSQLVVLHTDPILNFLDELSETQQKNYLFAIKKIMFLTAVRFPQVLEKRITDIFTNIRKENPDVPSLQQKICPSCRTYQKMEMFIAPTVNAKRKPKGYYRSCVRCRNYSCIIYQKKKDEEDAKGYSW